MVDIQWLAGITIDASNFEAFVEKINLISTKYMSQMHLNTN